MEGQAIRVEVDVAPGLPGFTIVGLADTALQEARERVRGAIRNSGYEYPPRRITVNLAPAELRKSGASLDLAIALGILVGSEQVSAMAAGRTGRAFARGRAAFSARLAADGSSPGATKSAAGRRARRGRREAGLAEGIEVVGAASLSEAATLVRQSRGGRMRRKPPRVELAADVTGGRRGPERGWAGGPQSDPWPDLAEVRGQWSQTSLELALAADTACHGRSPGVRQDAAWADRARVVAASR